MKAAYSGELETECARCLLRVPSNHRRAAAAFAHQDISFSGRVPEREIAAARRIARLRCRKRRLNPIIFSKAQAS